MVGDRRLGKLSVVLPPIIPPRLHPACRFLLIPGQLGIAHHIPPLVILWAHGRLLSLAFGHIGTFVGRGISFRGIIPLIDLLGEWCLLEARVRGIRELLGLLQLLDALFVLDGVDRNRG